MADTRSSVDRPVAIRQHLTAGNNFSGVAPADGGGAMTPTFANNIYQFASMTGGGLFDPSTDLYDFDRTEAIYFLGAELKLGNQTSWKIEHVDVDDTTTVTINSGTTETSKYISDSEGIVLLWGSKLKLTTVGSSQVMYATLKFVPYKFYKG